MPTISSIFYFLLVIAENDEATKPCGTMKRHGTSIWMADIVVEGLKGVSTLNITIKNCR